MTTPPDAEAVARETLAMLANDERTIRDVLDDGILDAPELLSAKRQLELTAHAAECVRFVAALDAGEIHLARGSNQWAIWHAVKAKKFRGPDVLTAFRAAQDHLKGGPDDGQ